jgi:histidinol-phosphate aminotransferase
VSRSFVEPGAAAFTTTPTFEMIPRSMRAAGAEVVEVPWLTGHAPVEEMLGAVRRGARLAALVSPNNPTGAAAGEEEVERLLSGSPVPVMIDLAYTEYAEQDWTELVLRAANGVAVRTLSKAWGLAGLRIGYVAAARELADRVRAETNPYPVSGPALAMALAWLGEGASFVRAHVDRVRWERENLGRLLTALSARPLESHANFVAARFEDAWTVADALARLGIAVRRFRAGSGFEDYLRITCPGNERDFARLCGAIGRAAAEVRP